MAHLLLLLLLLLLFLLLFLLLLLGCYLTPTLNGNFVPSSTGVLLLPPATNCTRWGRRHLGFFFFSNWPHLFFFEVILPPSDIDYNRLRLCTHLTLQIRYKVIFSLYVQTVKLLPESCLLYASAHLMSTSGIYCTFLLL